MIYIDIADSKYSMRFGISKILLARLEKRKGPGSFFLPVPGPGFFSPVFSNFSHKKIKKRDQAKLIKYYEIL